MTRAPAFRFAPLIALTLAVTLPGQVPSAWFDRGVGAGGAFYSPSINPANDNEYYVASDMSGLYHTTNFGDLYETVDSLQVQGGHYSAVCFTNNPLIEYTVTYTGGNNALPTKTTDGGVTWTVLPGNPIPDDDVYSLWVDYNNPNRVVLAGYSDLYFSADGGTTFNPISVTVDTSNGVLICGAFFNGNNIYLGTNAGLLVSANSGTSFTNAGTPGIPAGELMFSFTGAKVGGTMRFFCLTAAASYPGYDLGSDYYGNYRNIYSLDNGTGSWTAHSSGIDASQDFLQTIAMAQNDLNTVYAAGGSAAGVPVVFKSNNSGTAWTNTFLTANNQNINTGWSGSGGDRGWGYGEVVFGLAVAPNNSAKALITDYGFVHRTSDGGTTWQQAYISVADQHAVNTTAIAGGSYHSIGLEDTSVWQVVWGDSAHLFAGFSDIKGIRSSDGGATWTLGNTGDDANTMYRIVQHPVTHALYAATSDIHDMYQSTRLADNPLNNADANGKVIVSTNNGAAWQVVHSFGHPVFWLCLDPSNSNRMYASVVHSTAGGIFVTNDLQDGAASTWTKLANPPRTEGHPATIVVLNDGKVVCTYSGHRTTAFTASSGVFSYDPNAQAWTDVSATGMQYWTKDIVVDPADVTQNTWYVGVFSGWGGPPNGLGGLYRTTDRGAHWTRVNSLDRVTSVTFDPINAGNAFLTTETSGLWHTANIRATSPVFTRVDSYPFRQPERVFFDPYDPTQVWITSFGHALMVGYTVAPYVPPLDFNGDGKSDLLWQNTLTGDRLFWLMNGTAPVTGVDLATLPIEWSIGAVGDFNGDGQPDLVWQNAATGERLIWLMSGTTPTSAVALGTVTTDWLIVGAGDMNGDGKADILWTNSVTGERLVWLMNGTIPINSVSLGIVPFQWSLAGTGDFNGDGQTDLLFDNTLTGTLNVWFMNGTTHTSTFTIGTVSPQLQVAGVGDYNGDHQPDILWTNRFTGERSVWLMNEVVHTSTVSITTLGLNWELIHPVAHRVWADFNSDGQSDLMWNNTATGETLLYLMNGTTPFTGVSFGTSDPNVQIAATGDFNADGEADIVWQNIATGDRFIWLMSNTTMASSVDLGVVPTNWSILGTGDFNADGYSDLVWKNSTTGEYVVWLMNGTTPFNSISLGVIDANLQLVGTGDFNDDSSTDLVWQNTSTGERIIWLMNGTTFSSSVSLGVVSTDWTLAGTGDFNGDGQTDLVWTNTVTGERLIWLMYGTTPFNAISLGDFPTAWAIKN